MVRSFGLIKLHGYVILFLWCALVGKCADSLVNCDLPFHICGKYELYESFNCSESNIQNWYFAEVQTEDRKFIDDCTGLKEDTTKPSFKNLELFAFPVQKHIEEKPHENQHWTQLCVNISPEDLNSTDWLELDICRGGDVHTINITKRQQFCERKNEQRPITLFCYWNWLLTTTKRVNHVKVKLTSEESSEMLRVTLPKWENHNSSNRTKSCDFQPLVYSSKTDVNVVLKNCTSRFNVTIKRDQEEIVELGNVTLNQILKYKLEEDEQNKQYFYEVAVREILNNVSDQEHTDVTDISDVTTQFSTEFIPRKVESHPPYFLLYLIPIILIIVLSIACFILRKDIEFVWDKITGGSTTTPSVKFLYCNCSSHTIYKQQLKSFLLFIERYCNINIIDYAEQIYEDDESLLHGTINDTDYVIFVPMPELSTPDSEHESYSQHLQQEFDAVKETKQIILTLPFQGDIQTEEYIRPKSEYFITSKLCKMELLKKGKLSQPEIFNLMDDFIPFIKHVHRKYRRPIFPRGRGFLSRAKMNEIQQKLEDHNLTNMGFEFLRNNLKTEQLDENNSLSFVNLDNMSL